MAKTITERLSPCEGPHINRSLGSSSASVPLYDPSRSSLAFINMNRLIVVACLIAVVVGDSYTPIPILKDDRTLNSDGTYSFNFETGNGISRNEEGKQYDGQNTAGGWRYTAPDGNVISLTFTADAAGGYVPVGDHLPVTPTSVPLPYQRSGN
ncbi:endocuticle structural glycoprotein SgAbd-4-like [Oratosquilla oratoria]|uniref:endocuticle structural glycoprotein SgAbd-4-like n=1 Tax=Oratosquilla oratoria TaxID=337810 RepID=UPI003F766A13